ncbi:MAG: dihydroneopterin aldolase [Kiritimatiellae bacterium]|jgi:D-erythro-7,8-dihydroneopterin triphosphate epimerase|nr:dihydroneopterin aldolase [Kiritimatiellia bacterium]
MSDCIYIRDLALRTIIGIFPEERTKRQDILVNVMKEVESHAPAAATDALEDATDYKTITKHLIDHVEGSSYNLIETLAERCAGICLEAPAVQRVTVTIDKPGALRFARSVAVEVVRSKQNSKS